MPNSESRRPLDGARLLSKVKLPDLSGQSLWPPPAPPVLPEQVMPILPHPGRNWWQANEQRDRQRHAEAQRVASYYAQQAKEREHRDNAQARAARNGGAP